MNSPGLLDVVTHESPDGSANTDATSANNSALRSVGLWGLLLLLVVVFGYLTASRRKAIGTLVEQVADIVRDFQGYDPEF